jgi:hypothetical protein
VIVYLPCLLFLFGLALSYAGAGSRRQLGTMAMVAAVGWALSLLIGPAGALWAAGPLLATALLRRPGQRVRSSFEVLTRRATVLAGGALVALFLASQLPAGENPYLLNVVPWLLGAVGTAWVINPIDARERVQGQVLMVGATAALIQMAVPAGGIALTAAGLLALVPTLGLRAMLAAPWRLLLSPLLLGLAGVCALVALSGVAVASPGFAELPLTLSGSVLLGGSVVLLAAALGEPAGLEWSGLLGVLALISQAPTLRWSALAALLALATAVERNGERPAWLGLAALAAVPVLQGLAPSAWSARFQTVALATGLVCLLYASRAGLLRRVALPAAVFLVLQTVPSLTPGNLTRFQWIALGGGLLLSARVLLLSAGEKRGAAQLREALVMGLLLLAIAARDPLGLGALSTALLTIELVVVGEDVSEPMGRSIVDRLLHLAKSNWPPGITFAGATLAVIAALQASLALGLVASSMLAGLQLAPLFDKQTGAVPISAAGRWRWLRPSVSLLCGLAPALVARMLRL